LNLVEAILSNHVPLVTAVFFIFLSEYVK